jgi:hypothetical protein
MEKGVLIAGDSLDVGRPPRALAWTRFDAGGQGYVMGVPGAVARRALGVRDNVLGRARLGMPAGLPMGWAVGVMAGSARIFAERPMKV